ncbi:uncharacterized protein LOC124940263 [Impatiens glandulifera]|uniref:uncharacterized protein LOC124940263 n=1 Tax=Impatiens glandulifera TaxID=253017 RepID=UPI001FB057E3|nr:uncharacterized protein LOC124940263 [Impatiens glandulifera]XP_047336719.1 uncharacterized protein LOC124940263 [Impatiens glandulifera]
MSQIGSERTAKMNYDPRRFLNPHHASRKRKERESVLQIKPLAPSGSKLAGVGVESGDCSNRILAGYMAHEFLTNGTLLGQKWDPARAEAVPLSSRGLAQKLRENRQSYADVARLLKGGETQVAGVVNPTQLARWIQM